MAKGLTDDQIKALTESEMRQSVGFFGGKLANQRQKSLVYYEGLAQGDLAPPEVEGRSSVVSPDVRNVIESMLPDLMAKFASSERVVEAQATKPGDEVNADVITDYLNYLFYKKCSGHKLLEVWFKDALISKAGIVKVWWDNRYEETREEYRGLSDVELAQLADDEEIEITEQKSYPDEEDQEQKQQALEHLAQQGQQAQQAASQGDPQAQQAVQQIMMQLQQLQAQAPKMCFDVVCKRKKKGGKIAIENVPPEEFLISRKAKNIQDAPFVGHRVMRTASELKSMGYKNVDAITSDDNGQQWSMERIERIAFDDEQPYNSVDNPTPDPSQRIIWVTECYLRADRDGDGIAELLKVVRAGNELLEVETIDVIPFVHIVPIVMPHRFFGLSVADLAMEPQRIKTSILRAMLDNLYLQVNGRYFAVEGQVNLDDLLTSRPGGVVRIKQPGMVGRLDQSVSDSSSAMGMLNYMQAHTEESTGWTRMANGVENPDSLSMTATKANLDANKSQMRLDLIARNFAEGVQYLFKLMLKLVCQNQEDTVEAYLQNKWVSVDPREWRNQFEFNINVGLGTGSKDQQVRNLSLQLQHQQQSYPLGIVTAENVYQTSKKLSEALGFKNAELYWTDPAQQPPKPPVPNPEEIKAQTAHALAQQNAQLEQQKMQMQLQIEQQKMQMQAQLEQQKMQMQMESDKSKQEYQARENALKFQLEDQRNQAQTEMDLKVAQMKMLTERNTQVLLAHINNGAKIEAARIGASEDDGALPYFTEEQAVQAMEHPLKPLADAIGQNNASMTSAISNLVNTINEQHSRPKTIIRGEDGSIQGIA